MPSLPGFERLEVMGRRPALPAEVRIYAIGDIHGRLDLLDNLLSRVDEDRTRRPIARSVMVFLGDYIDRGPRSRETIDRLIERRHAGECLLLKGNHEQIAIRGLTDPDMFQRWLRLGGVDTLVSYGVTPAKLIKGRQIVELQGAFHRALPQSHLKFFRDLPTSFACGDYFFVHAGVKPFTELECQTDNDLLWIREEFLTSPLDFGKIVVHGHTPTADIELRPNRINIDTGAYATGKLTCLVLEGSLVSYIDTFRS